MLTKQSDIYFKCPYKILNMCTFFLIFTKQLLLSSNKIPNQTDMKLKYQMIYWNQKKIHLTLLISLLYSLALGDGWNNVILETEEELNFIINAMPFLPAYYHGKFLLGGSTNQRFPSCSGSIEFSNYLSDRSGRKHSFSV